jgi:hypothetical protein
MVFRNIHTTFSAQYAFSHFFRVVLEAKKGRFAGEQSKHFPKRNARTSNMSRLSRGEAVSPPKITIAIGPSILRPVMA